MTDQVPGCYCWNCCPAQAQLTAGAWGGTPFVGHVHGLRAGQGALRAGGHKAQAESLATVLVCGSQEPGQELSESELLPMKLIQYQKFELKKVLSKVKGLSKP